MKLIKKTKRFDSLFLNYVLITKPMWLLFLFVLYYYRRIYKQINFLQNEENVHTFHCKINL